MQKRNLKGATKQLPLPSTAATSNMNQQLMVINEASSSQLHNGRHSGLQPGFESSLLQSDISQKSYLNKLNNNDFSVRSKNNFSKINNNNNMANQSFQTKNDNQENSSRLINMTMFHDEFSPTAADQQQFEQQSSQFFFSDNPRTKGAGQPSTGSRGDNNSAIASLISPDKNKKYNKQGILNNAHNYSGVQEQVSHYQNQQNQLNNGPSNANIILRQSFNKDGSQYQLNGSIKMIGERIHHQNSIQHQQLLQSQVKIKKRKNQTEPNSPVGFVSSHDISNSMSYQQSSRAIIMNNQIVIGREMPIRLSGNKLNIQKSTQQQNGVSVNKSKHRKQQQDQLLKLNNSLDDHQGIAEFINGANPRHEANLVGHEGQNGYLTHHLNSNNEEKSSFLPRLDLNHRYSNSQVQYRDPNELNTYNRNDSKEKSDMQNKNASNSWINESLNSTMKKGSISQERQNPQIQVSYGINDFSSHNNNKNAQLKSAKPKNNKNSYNTATNILSDISPKNNNVKDFSELYSLKNGIGKVQPVPEIKTQFNEQVIRGKIYREKMLNSETPQKPDISLISIGRIGSTGIAHSEVVSPQNNIGSPLHFQFESNKPIRGIQQATAHRAPHVNTVEQTEDRKMSKTRILNVSELSEDYQNFNTKLQHLNQFQYRNYSISQGSQKQDHNDRFQPQSPQYNTIEDIVRTSKENGQNLMKSGQISLLEQTQPAPSFPPYLEDPNFSGDKNSTFSRIQSSVYSGASNQELSQQTQNQQQSHLNTSSISLQKQFHHTIKTVASKQMPKCFRMSKHQLQIIQRQNDKQSNLSSNRIVVNDGGQNKFDHTFLITKQNSSNQRSSSNDARLSFSNEGASHSTNPQYQTIQRSKIDFSTPVRTSQKFPKNMFNEENYAHQQKSSTDRLDIDRERMTPAFNARQSYNNNKQLISQC
eukprot:403373452